jgi:outer membrane protein
MIPFGRMKIQINEKWKMENAKLNSICLQKIAIMVKYFLTACLIALAFTPGTLRAQTKIGYISVDAMVSLMPEARSLDSLLNKYQSDSLNPKYEEMVMLYKYKDSLYRDSIHTPPAMRKQIAGELPILGYQIQNWDQISQNATQNKQNALLVPAYRKVYEAIKAVQKEKGYTHVANKEAFLIAPEGDDMTRAVAAKLKINVPPQMPIGAKL